MTWTEAREASREEPDDVSEPASVETVRRILDHHRRRTTTLADREVFVDPAGYRDPATLAAEQRDVFERHPIPVAHVSQLPRPGSYATATIADRPLVVVRDGVGGVAGYLNVCRHRGARLVEDRGGAAGSCLTCPYHGWSYDLEDGQLRGIPDRVQSFPHVDPASRGLVAVHVELAAGFVWVRVRDHLDADALDSVRADPELMADDFVVYEETTEQRAFNWKIGVEGFLENYHFAYLHRDSTDPVFLHNLAVIEAKGHHVRAVAPKRSILDLKDQPTETWELAPHATVLHVVFPSTCIFVEKDHLSMVRMLPTAPDRCEVTTTHVVRYDRLSLRRHWDRNIALFSSAVGEDFAVYESIQAGLAAEANDELVFGRCEVGLQMFRRMLDTARASA